MKVTIDLTEEEAACLWGNAWTEPGATLPELVKRAVEIEAANYRRAFPGAVAALVERVRSGELRNPNL